MRRIARITTYVLLPGWAQDNDLDEVEVVGVTVSGLDSFEQMLTTVISSEIVEAKVDIPMKVKPTVDLADLYRRYFNEYQEMPR